MRRNVERFERRQGAGLRLLARRFRLIVLIVWSAIALGLSPNTVQAEGYRYPYRDPYLATVTTAILTADGMTPRLKREAIHVRVLAAHHLADHFGAGMLGGREQRLDDREALRRDRQSAPAASRGEFRHAPRRVSSALALVDQLQLHS